ncbi:MAG: ArgE/DapE family deacylase [Chloroflexi bacterium]|nr:ArgE/DapE family deacylase [Chloroflexota bacterium]
MADRGATVLTPAAARAGAAVDDARAVEDLVRLVRTPSVTGDERAVQDLAAAMLADIGCRVERIETDPAAFAATDPEWPGAEMPRTELPVVVGRLGRPGGRRILLVGHTDVVPIGDPARWTVDPWGGDVSDGQVWGRGAADMKGGCASILAAARAIVASGAADVLAGELVIAFVPSEEDGGQGMLAAIRAGITADMAVITEPTDLDIVIAHAGALTFRLTVPGRAAHASMRRDGVSALDNLMTLIRALEVDEAARNAAETDPLMTALGLPYPTMVGMVRGGDWASTVMDRVVADGRYGVALGETWRDAEARLRRVIAGAAAADPFLRDHPPAIEFLGGKFSSARVPADHHLPTSLRGVASTTLGRTPDLLGEPYGADMRLLVNEGRTPTVIFGPGHVKRAHIADEGVPVADVTACARTLAAWVVSELSPAG